MTDGCCSRRPRHSRNRLPIFPRRRPTGPCRSTSVTPAAVRVKEESGHIAGHPVIVRVVASEARLHQEIAELSGW